MIIPANTPYILVLKSHKFSCIPHLAYGMNYVCVCFLSEKTWRNTLFSHLSSSCFTYPNPTGTIDCCLCLHLFFCPVLPKSGSTGGEGGGCVRACARAHAHMYACVLSRSVMSSLCDPMDCSPPGSAVHGTVQARIPQWVAISFSRGSSWPRVLTCVSCVFCIDRWTLYHWTTGEAQDTLITQVTKPLLSRGEVSRPQPHLMPWNVSPAMRLCAKHQGRTLCSSKLQSPQCISLPNHPLYMVALLPLSPYLSILLPTTTSDMQDP